MSELIKALLPGFNSLNMNIRYKDNKVFKITEDVKWIGVKDYDIETFDIVMQTEFGTTYNSYFVNADKKTIIEASKESFSDIHLGKLLSVVDPAEIQYIVLDHTEPDHSGNVGNLLDVAPRATIVGSGNAIRYLGDILNRPFKSLVVKDGDKLDLGNKTLRFISAPNLHWPDTMMTWLGEDKILFTCDFFGAHYCFEDIFTDFSDNYLESFRYYFDVIMKPFSRFALKAVEKIRDLDIKYICPGHAPVHRDNWQRVVKMTSDYSKEYLELTEDRDTRNILITYVSAYGFTRRMAEQISEGILDYGETSVTIRDIEKIPMGDLESELVLADAILIGSPTINQNTLLPIYKLFSLINPIRDKSKAGGAFGSYGWSGEAPGIISEVLKSLKLRVFEDKAALKFKPGNEKGESLRDYGRSFAEFVMEKQKQ
jgi:flavorubredoxin